MNISDVFLLKKNIFSALYITSRYYSNKQISCMSIYDLHIVIGYYTFICFVTQAPKLRFF